MSASALIRSRTRRVSVVVSLGAPRVIAAVVASRLLILAAGAAGSLAARRAAGWLAVDPQRLSASFGPLGNALTAASVRWDAVGYLEIAGHGYAHASQTILFPLYPLLIAGLSIVVPSPVLAAVLISWVSFGVGLWLVHQLCELELGLAAADACVLLLAFAPVSLFFTAVYTESLFLALSAGALLAARRERWLLAAGLVALASVTRVTGILLVVPVAVALVRARGWREPRVVLLLGAPAALAAFLAYLAARGYGWLAPLDNQRAHALDGPAATVVAAVRLAATGLTQTLSGVAPVSRALTGPFTLAFDSVVLLAVLAVACGALVLTWRRLPSQYGAYATLALLVCVASRTRLEPLEGLDRYCLTIVPLWMAAGAFVAERRATALAVATGACLMCFYALSFATWTFIA